MNVFQINRGEEGRNKRIRGKDNEEREEKRKKKTDS